MQYCNQLWKKKKKNTVRNLRIGFFYPKQFKGTGNL